MPEPAAAAASAAGPPESPASPSAGGVVLSNYLVQHTLGQGTFGKVKLAQHMPTGERVAIKILEKARIKEVADAQRVAREIKILKRIRHPNVIQLFEVIDAPRQIFLVMEFLDGGELFDYIVRHQRIREDVAVRFFHDIVDGLSYLHRKEVAHRDLKPENVLMQRRPDGYRLKIIDFGLSNTFDGGRVLKTACGSPCYAAPELLLHQPYRGEAADVWSLSVVLFAMIAGHLPYEDQNTAKLYDKILRADYKCPRWLSSAARDLLGKMFQTDPANRATIADIRRHPWYTQIMVPSQPVKSTPSSLEELNAYVVAEAEALGISRVTLAEHLMRNAHNNVTATYYLLTERMLRNGVSIDTASAGAAAPAPAVTAVSARAAATGVVAAAAAEAPPAARPATAGASLASGHRGAAAGASDRGAAAAASGASTAAGARPATSAIPQRGVSSTAGAAAAAAAAGSSRPGSAKQRAEASAASASGAAAAPSRPGSAKQRTASDTTPAAAAPASARVAAAPAAAFALPPGGASQGASSPGSAAAAPPSAAAAALRKAQRSVGSRPDSARAPSPTPAGTARAPPPASAADEAAPQSSAQHAGTKRVAVADIANMRQSSQQPTSQQQPPRAVAPLPATATSAQAASVSLKDDQEVRPAENVASSSTTTPERSHSRARALAAQEAASVRAQARADAAAAAARSGSAVADVTAAPASAGSGPAAASGAAARLHIATEQLRRPVAPEALEQQLAGAPSSGASRTQQPSGAGAFAPPSTGSGAATTAAAAIPAPAPPHKVDDLRAPLDVLGAVVSSTLSAPSAVALQSRTPQAPISASSGVAAAQSTAAMVSGPGVGSSPDAVVAAIPTEGLPSMVPSVPVGSADERRRANKRSASSGPAMQRTTRALAAEGRSGAAEAAEESGAYSAAPRGVSSHSQAAPGVPPGPAPDAAAALSSLPQASPLPATPAPVPRQPAPMSSAQQPGGGGEFGTPREGGDASFLDGEDVGIDVSLSVSMRDSTITAGSGFVDGTQTPGQNSDFRRTGGSVATATSRRPAANGEALPAKDDTGVAEVAAEGAKSTAFPRAEPRQQPAEGAGLLFRVEAAAASGAIRSRSTSSGSSPGDKVPPTAAAPQNTAAAIAQPGTLQTPPLPQGPGASLVVEGVAAAPTYFRYPAIAAPPEASDAPPQQPTARLAEIARPSVSTSGAVRAGSPPKPLEVRPTHLQQPALQPAPLTVSVMGVHPVAPADAGPFSATKTQALLVQTQQGAAAAASARQPQALQVQAHTLPSAVAAAAEPPRSMTAAVGSRGVAPPSARAAAAAFDFAEPAAPGGALSQWPPMAVNGQTIPSPHPPQSGSGGGFRGVAAPPHRTGGAAATRGPPDAAGDGGPPSPSALSAEARALQQGQQQRPSRPSRPSGRSVSVPPTTEWTVWARPSTAGPAGAAGGTGGARAGGGGFFDMLVAGHNNKPPTAAQLQAQLQQQLQQEQQQQPQQPQPPLASSGHHHPRHNRPRGRHTASEDSAAGGHALADGGADVETDGSSASQAAPAAHALARDVPTISQAERMLSPNVQRQRQHLHAVYGPPPYTLPGQQLQGAPPGFVALAVPSRPSAAAAAGPRGGRPGTASHGMRRGRQLTIARNYPQPWNPAAGAAAAAVSESSAASTGGTGEPPPPPASSASGVRTGGLGRFGGADMLEQQQQQAPPPSALMHIISTTAAAASSSGAPQYDQQQHQYRGQAPVVSPRPPGGGQQQPQQPASARGASGGPHVRAAWQPLDEPAFGRPAAPLPQRSLQQQQQRWSDGGRATPEPQPPQQSYAQQPQERGSVRTAWPQRPPSAGNSGRSGAAAAAAAGEGGSGGGATPQVGRPQSAARRPTTAADLRRASGGQPGSQQQQSSGGGAAAGLRERPHAAEDAPAQQQLQQYPTRPAAAERNSTAGSASPRAARLVAPKLPVDDLDSGVNGGVVSAEDRLSKWAAMLSPQLAGGGGGPSSGSPQRLSPAAGSGGTSSNNLAALMQREQQRAARAASVGRTSSGERYALAPGDGAGGTGATSEAAVIVGSSGSIATQLL